MEEVWKAVDGFGGYFEASNLGRIRRSSTGHVYKTSKCRGGYCDLNTWYQGRRIHIRVHRFVALAFHKRVGEADSVNHIDGNKENNKPDNLEWVTIQENNQHAFDIGLKNCRHQRSLNDEQVREILSVYIKGSVDFGCSALSKKYGVSVATINRIVNGKLYKEVFNDREHICSVQPSPS